MRALWLEDGKIRLRDDIPLPTPATGEALIRVRLAGICGTDLQLLQGYYPFTGIPGHEFVGDVVTAADSTWIGQRVVGEINVGCGRCRHCISGRNRHCERRSVLGIRDRHGAFAEYLTLPLANLHRVPAPVPDETAVFTEPLAAALQIQTQIAIDPKHRVLLIGAGRLGQLIAQTLALTGCELQVAARHISQKAQLELRGIASVDADAVPASGYDVVVEATGSPTGFAQARQAVRPGGTLVLKSTYRGRIAVDLAQVVVDEINVIGSRCGPFEPALDLLVRGVIEPKTLIAGTYPLESSAEAFREASRAGVLKILLRPPAPDDPFGN